MTLQELIAASRARLDDVSVQADGSPAPTLWSDPEITGFLNEAEREAAERARLLRDEVTNDVTLIPIVASQPEYDLHPSVFDVDSVRYEDTGRPLKPTSAYEIDGDHIRWRSIKQGRSHYFIVQTLPSELLRLRLVPIPMQDEYASNDDPAVMLPTQVRLLVYRRPLVKMADPDDTPEIAERHHERLIDWVCFRAFSRRDRDTYDPSKASDAEGTFIASFGIRPTAEQQRQQRERRRETTQYHSF